MAWRAWADRKLEHQAQPLSRILQVDVGKLRYLSKSIPDSVGVDPKTLGRGMDVAEGIKEGTQRRVVGGVPLRVVVAYGIDWACREREVIATRFGEPHHENPPSN